MLPKSRRLTRRRDFREVYEKGRSYANRAAVVYVLHREGTGSRVGFSVSRRIGSAVDRNREKRRFREVIRVLCKRVKPGVDLVFVVRRGAMKMEFRELEKSLRDLLGRAGVFRDERRDSSQ
ncbi:MAG: ribonuclease P protein component [Bacillota bacterium]